MDIPTNIPTQLDNQDPPKGRELGPNENIEIPNGFKCSATRSGKVSFGEGSIPIRNTFIAIGQQLLLNKTGNSMPIVKIYLLDNGNFIVHTKSGSIYTCTIQRQEVGAEGTVNHEQAKTAGSVAKLIP